MSDRTPSHDQTGAERQAEQDEISRFNQNTDYDASTSLYDEASDVNDPFSPHNLAIQTFITTARVYDALLTLITLKDAAVAKDLMELHMNGHLLGPAPGFSGTFLTDEMNGEDREENLHAGEFDDTQ
jgi:hypothetical protein